jgi:uncharacterized ion transporter superfamily protein YfcC
MFAEDHAERARHEAFKPDTLSEKNPRLGRTIGWFLAFFILILVVFVSGPLLPAISQFALPLVGLLSLGGGTGADLISGAGGKMVLKATGEGVAGIMPGIPLILMTTSIKHIVAQGGILHSASMAFSQASPFLAALTVYGLALLIEFFIAYCFGDGFSNLAYPTNPVLLICLSLTAVSYASSGRRSFGSGCFSSHSLFGDSP